MTVVSTDPFTASVQALTEGLRTVTNEPLDQIRVLSQLATYEAGVTTGSSTLSSAVTTAAQATAALCRRAALASLALATAAYNPTSFTEAQAVVALMTPLFDSEIQAAADAGDAASYLQLRTLRSAVVTDLETRATGLPELIQYTLPDNFPACVVAYRLYQDAGRADELVRRTDPIHPLFMDRAFVALSA